MKDRQKIDDFFKDRLSEFTMPVNDRMWENIQQGVKKNRFRFLLPWIMAGSTVALITSLYLWRSETVIIEEPITDGIAMQSGIADEQVREEANVAESYNNEDVKNIDNELVRINSTNKSASLDHHSDAEVKRSNDGVNSSIIKDRTNSQNRLSSDISKSGNIAITGKYDEKEAGFLNEAGERISADESDFLKDENESNNAFNTSVGLSVLSGPVLNNLYLLNSSEMGLPRLRKIRDRNCDDEAFVKPRTFFEFSYGYHKGSMNFRSTGAEFDDYMNLRNNGELWKSGTNLQALVGLQLGKRLFFKTGVNYTRVETSYHFVDQVNKRMITDSIWNGTGWDVTMREEEIAISGTNSYTFLDIPLLLSYGWQFNKVGLAVTTGPMINLYFGREGQLPSLIGQGIDLADGTWNDREIYRKTAGLNWYSSVQLSYQTYKNVELFIEPRIVAGLNSLTLENDGQEPDVSKISYPISQRMIQYGVGVGLRFSITH